VKLDRDAIIRENPLLQYCQSLGWKTKRDGPNGRFKCKCPFHDDNDPSFTIYSKENKGHCFGCGKNATVIDLHMLVRGLSVGEAMRDLWTRHHGDNNAKNKSNSASSAQSNSKTQPAKKKEEVFHHDYVDAKGEMVFQVVKTVSPGRKNKYKQRRRVGGKWVDNIEGVERVPYRLPELLASPASVWIVEGEKDVETLRAVGQVATCNSGGAKQWKDEHSEQLRGLHVWIAPDNDEVGREHGRMVFASLDGIATSVKWIDLPAERNGRQVKDISDLYTACNSDRDAFLDALGELQQQAESQKGADTEKIADALCAILKAVEELLRSYVVFLSNHEFVVIAFWAAFSWVLDAFDFTPYLQISSPVKECGKTRVFEILSKICKKAWMTIGPTEAVLFRVIHSQSPTLLLDEIDTVFKDKVDPNKEGVRAVLNAGYERGATVPRCHGPNHDVKHFGVFCPKAFAGIGNIPDTVASRSIKIAMVRRKKSQKVKRLRKRELNAAATPIIKALKDWSDDLDVLRNLRNARPQVPEELGDRGADICEPLLALADMAGGDWPQRLRDALKHLMAKGEADDGDMRIRLLASIREIFQGKWKDEKNIPTEDLLEELVKLEGEPWGAWWGGAVFLGNTRGPGSELAKLLKGFSIVPRSVRQPDGTSPKGYPLDLFSEAFERYL
jgi:hypothetical protein